MEQLEQRFGFALCYMGHRCWPTTMLKESLGFVWVAKHV
jgi:hypothetical protein